MLSATQWVLLKYFKNKIKKATKERTAHLIYTWNFSNYSEEHLKNSRKTEYATLVKIVLSAETQTKIGN